MPDVIYSYDELLSLGNINAALFWIVEYSPEEMGSTGVKRYSLFCNECLTHPEDFKDRFNKRIYRLWTTTPREIPW